MKTKILLPLVSAALMVGVFTACSDDSSPTSIDNSVGGSVSQETPSDSVQNSITDIPSENGEDVVIPAEPIDSINPVDPVIPDLPVDPTIPEQPVDPTVPTDPIVPDQPVVPVTPSAGAPAEPTIGADGFAAHWVRSDEGLVTFPENVTTPVDDFSNYTYYGAELTGVDQFHYGRFEARMKMVSIPGSVSSMFLYYDDSWKKGDIPWNEIDIEILGKNPGVWQSNIITRIPDSETGRKNANITSEAKHQYGFDATADFHLYAMIWTPEYISWEIDSVEVRRDYLGEKKGQVEFMTEEQSLRFNLWAAKSTAWVGKFTGAELAEGPQTQWIDYVRVYKYDEATKAFTLDWQDDFEGSDLSDHWATGSWEMEHVMLSPSNVVVEDGYCKLMMTREAN